MREKVPAISLLGPRWAVIGLLCLLLAAPAGSEEELTVRVLEPRHQPAERLIQVLRPLVPAPGSVNAFQGRLVVKTTAAIHTDLERVVARLDRASQDLLISVRHGFVGERGLDTAGGDPGYRLSNRARGDERDLQRLRVREGETAFISSGEEIPVAERRLTDVQIVDGQRGGAAIIHDAISYRSADTGFIVRARLSGTAQRDPRNTSEIAGGPTGEPGGPGSRNIRERKREPEQELDEVTIEVAAYRVRPGRSGSPTFRTAELRSTITSRLGEWVEVGATVERAEASDSHRTHRTQARERSNRRIYLKVELASGG